MGSKEKKFKQVCKCENCGNEAEMVVTCTLEELEEEESPKAEAAKPPRTKGTSTCSHCGNEADIWVQL